MSVQASGESMGLFSHHAHIVSSFDKAFGIMAFCHLFGCAGHDNVVWRWHTVVRKDPIYSSTVQQQVLLVHVVD